MLLLDLAMVVITVIMFVAAVFLVREIRRKIKPEIVGTENAQAADAKGKRRCHFCKKGTDARVDVFKDGLWYHYTCYTNQDGNNQQKKEEKQNEQK